VNTSHIDPNTTIFIKDMKALTSSAIKVAQPVAEGGAAVVGKFDLPLNPESFAGTTLLVPKDKEEFKRQYRILKYFENGGAINLLEEFDFDDILDVPDWTDPKPEFKPVLVVIDGPVPAEDKDTKRVYNDLYGVRLSDDGKYLYVYDGYEDDLASDPIALAAKPAASSKSGGGCDAGYGIIALLVAGLAALGRRRA
jgi:hypothetical protein